MLIYGINPVIELLRSRYKPDEIFIKESKKNPGLAKIRNLARQTNLKLSIISANKIRELSETTEHQGACALVNDLQAMNLLELNTETRSLVMMDGIQDPHNFGAAIRVCEVFGAKDIVFHSGNSCGITAAAIKASAGAVFHCHLYQTNLNRAVKWLKEREYQIFVLDGSGDSMINSVSFAGKVCIVIGSEGFGVRHAIRRLADRTIKIPMQGMIESLNVSCALSTVLYEKL